MIKTVTISSGTQSKIDITGGAHVKIKNLGVGTVYVSKYANVIAESNEVKSVQSGTTDILTHVATYEIKDGNADYYGTIYMIADTDCKVELETTNNPNFRQTVKGGDGSTSTALDDVLKSNARYQLGVLTSNITITLPETATADIEVDFAIADTTYAITCDYLSLDVVSDTYYQIFFSYDKALKNWFASVVSSDYALVSTTAEVETDETT